MSSSTPTISMGSLWLTNRSTKTIATSPASGVRPTAVHVAATSTPLISTALPCNLSYERLKAIVPCSSSTFTPTASPVAAAFTAANWSRSPIGVIPSTGWGSRDVGYVQKVAARLAMSFAPIRQIVEADCMQHSFFGAHRQLA